MVYKNTNTHEKSGYKMHITKATYQNIKRLSHPCPKVRHNDKWEVVRTLVKEGRGTPQTQARP